MNKQGHPQIADPGERWVSLRRVRWAITFGVVGWLPWPVVLLGRSGAYYALTSGFATAVIMLPMLAWGSLFCGLGRVVCFRREDYALAAAPFPWRAAICLNYGWFASWAAIFSISILLRP